MTFLYCLVIVSMQECLLFSRVTVSQGICKTAGNKEASILSCAVTLILLIWGQSMTEELHSSDVTSCSISVLIFLWPLGSEFPISLTVCRTHLVQAGIISYGSLPPNPPLFYSYCLEIFPRLMSWRYQLKYIYSLNFLLYCPVLALTSPHPAFIFFPGIFIAIVHSNSLSDCFFHPLLEKEGIFHLLHILALSYFSSTPWRVPII